MSTDFDTRVKVAIYRHFADTGGRPTPQQVADHVGGAADEVLGAYQRLRAQRVLVLESDGATIRMAPPFSGVPTQHVVAADGKHYYANCAWDAFGIAAALHTPAEVRSRCEQTHELLKLRISPDGPEPSSWLFHCLVPAAKWWDDIVFT
jgi:hypothetical protein